MREGGSELRDNSIDFYSSLGLPESLPRELPFSEGKEVKVLDRVNGTHRDYSSILKAYNANKFGLTLFKWALPLKSHGKFINGNYEIFFINKGI